MDSTGKVISIEQDPGPSVPVGWIQTIIRSGEQHEVGGLSIVLGDVERGKAESVVRAKTGQSVRIHFIIPNYTNAEQNAKPLKTGEIEFKIVDRKRIPLRQDVSENKTSTDSEPDASLLIRTGNVSIYPGVKIAKDLLIL